MNFLKDTKFQFSSLVLTIVVVGLAVFVYKHPRGRDAELAARNQRAMRGPNRQPASIQKVFDFSYLKGDALTVAAKSRLLSSTFISKDANNAVIDMGNFVMLDDDNEKDFACGYFDQVELTFNAEGVAVEGDRPTLTVVTGCQVGSNINSLTPIRIPVDKLTAQAPGDSEYKFFDSQPMSLQLSDATPQWPHKWQLSDIKLTNSKISSRILHITSQDIQQTGIIMMNW